MPEAQNLGLAGDDYSVVPSLVTTTLFAWVCNRGPLQGGVPLIDDLHYQQALALVSSSKSIPLHVTSTAAHQGGVLIVGAYDDYQRSYNWVSILNAPNTGSGGPRGTFSYDRGLTRNPRWDGRAGWRFLGVGGALWFDLFYWEDDNSANRIAFQFDFASSETEGPYPTTHAVQLLR